MSKKQYIALQAIQYVDENGTRKSIEPRSEKHSGLFKHEFDTKTEKRLLGIGAIRAPEGTEEYEGETAVENLHDSRDLDGEVDPLDHDANGKKGGSKPATETAAQKKARLAAEKADADAKAAAEKADADAKAAAENGDDGLLDG